MSEGKILVRQADIHRAKPVKWAWSGRIVRDNFNLVVGNEGIGKGTLVAWILANLTKGKLPGSLEGHPVNVGVIGDEDDFDTIWAARVVGACGGIQNRVKYLVRDDFDQVDIYRDIEMLGKAVSKHRIKVLYFDQFLDNLAVATDHYHAKQVRAAVAPLRSIAKELGVTTVATLHPNKRAENFRQLVQGTSAFNALARSSLYLAEHPDKEGVRVLVTAKSNYYRTGAALEFKVVEWADRPNGYLLKQPKPVAFHKSDVTLDELIAQGGKGRPGPKGGAVREILKGILADGEWHDATSVFEVVENAGFAERTARGVANRMYVEVKREGFGGKVKWRLPRSDD